MPLTQQPATTSGPPSAATAPGAPRRRPSASCLLVVGAAGYGKSTELRAAADAVGCVVLEGAALEQWLRRAQAPHSERGAHVFVDGFADLPDSVQLQLVEALRALPDSTSVSLASRRPLGPELVSGLGRRCVEIGPDDLALGFVEVVDLLRSDCGITDADLASRVRELTAGWPELVVVLGASIGADAASPSDNHDLAHLTAAGSPVAQWVHRQVLDQLSPSARALAEQTAHLAPLSHSLVRAVWADPAAESALDELASLGVIRSLSPASQGRDDLLGLVPAVALVLRDQPCDPGTMARAASWYESNDLPLAAARAAAAAGDLTRCRDLIASRGNQMLATGGATEVVGLAGARLPGEPRELTLIRADAARMAGDVTTAMRDLRSIAADLDGALPDDLAWRLAGAHYLRADYRAAADICARALAEPGEPAPDQVRVLAARATCAFMLGDVEGATSDARAAVSAAEALDDDSALAFAHLSRALTSAGARRSNHLALALAAARRAGDVVTAARVLVNQADSLLDSADYDRAHAVAAQSLEFAERLAPGVLISGLHNMGEALARLGRADEARPYFERSVAICRRLGLERTAGGLWGLAVIEHQWGHRDQAVAALAEVVDLARDNIDHQVLVPALATLARALATPAAAGEPDFVAAEKHAAEAVASATTEFASAALTALGWVRWARGDQPGAGSAAGQALAMARSRQHAHDCAEALELVAATVGEPVSSRAAAVEALDIWARAGAELAVNRVALRLGESAGSSGAERARAAAATRWLSSRGARVDVLSLGTVEAAAPEVQINVLGGFDVSVAGATVPIQAWKSRQARSLLKILTAARGRPTTRAEVCERLWPDDDPQRTGHRLSVLLSAVRGVLDPERARPADHYIKADLVGVSLDTAHLRVDATEFLRDADEAAALAAADDDEHALALLVELDRAYGGAAFEDDPDADWADSLREETRAARVRGLRMCARLAHRAGEHDLAISCQVRLLDNDRYDESAHRDLVGLLLETGRHGEARRAFDRWHDAMLAIDAPLPDSAMLCRSGRVLIRH